MTYPIHETRDDLELDMSEKNLLKLEFTSAPWEIVGTVTRVGRDFFEITDQQDVTYTRNILDILCYRMC